MEKIRGRFGATRFAGLVAATLTSAAAFGQLTVAGNDRLFQSELGGLVEEFDYFGWALAAGDFNRDGYADLAVGVPGESVGAVAGAGAVFVAYSGPAGIGTRAPLNHVLHQNVSGVAETAETGDNFGRALASGDVNGDGYADLVVGSPFESLSDNDNAGAVHLFLGGPGGLAPAGAGHLLHGGSFGATASIQANAQFGAALVICDRNADGRDDLVIGIPSAIQLERPGAVLEVRGVANGLTTTGAVRREAPEADAGDEFGSALACGLLAGGAGDDLLVGAPGTFDAGGEDRDGAAWRISEAGVFLRMLDGSLNGSRTGTAVVVGRFDSRSLDRAAWSNPSEDHFQILDSGQVQTLNFAIEQGGGGAGDEIEALDYFGEVMAAGDFNRDGYDELVFGTPREDHPHPDVGTLRDSGLVQILAGPITGPTQPFQASFRWGEQFGFAASVDDRFGGALAVGDFDKDGIEDLAIGAPLAEWNAQEWTGIVQILFGSLPGWIFGDSFESADLVLWDAAAP